MKARDKNQVSPAGRVSWCWWYRWDEPSGAAGWLRFQLWNLSHPHCQTPMQSVFNQSPANQLPSQIRKWKKARSDCSKQKKHRRPGRTRSYLGGEQPKKPLEAIRGVWSGCLQAASPYWCSYAVHPGLGCKQWLRTCPEWSFGCHVSFGFTVRVE